MAGRKMWLTLSHKLDRGLFGGHTAPYPNKSSTEV